MPETKLQALYGDPLPDSVDSHSPSHPMSGQHTSGYRSRRPAFHAMPALRRFQQGRWGYILAWLIGVPVPILVVIYLLRGCT